MTTSSDEVLDCAVVGGGPAGLTAAIYLSRYRLTVAVFDDETSRTAMIPILHNHAGFPDGISGGELLARMRTQAQRYGASIRNCRIIALQKKAGVFMVDYKRGTVRARTILLATGVINRRPPMSTTIHDAAVARGLLRYCPVCDGFEVVDKPIAIIGTGGKGVHEATFLRSYTRDVTLISPDGAHSLSKGERDRLSELGIGAVDGPVTAIELVGDKVTVTASAGGSEYDSIYPALGSDIRSELGAHLGAQITDEGCIWVDSHQRTNVPGLYAAGDVVIGLDQISHAMGQAGVAATAIRNDLSEVTALLR